MVFFTFFINSSKIRKSHNFEKKQKGNCLKRQIENTNFRLRRAKSVKNNLNTHIYHYFKNRRPKGGDFFNLFEKVKE